MLCCVNDSAAPTATWTSCGGAILKSSRTSLTSRRRMAAFRRRVSPRRNMIAQLSEIVNRLDAALHGSGYADVELSRDLASSPAVVSFVTAQVELGLRLRGHEGMAFFVPCVSRLVFITLAQGASSHSAPSRISSSPRSPLASCPWPHASSSSSPACVQPLPLPLPLPVLMEP